MRIETKVWPSLYQDSVVLMRIAGTLRKRDGVAEAAAFMGTPGNHELLREIGLETPEGAKAGPNDLIVTLKVDGENIAEAAFDEAYRLLREKVASNDEDEDEGAVRPRSLDSALRILPHANLAAISVPGQYAGTEAMRALRRGLNVFLFSDNVSVEREIELKTEARKRNLFCMGPDCGTAYIGGHGLGFFNVVERGRVGCVAASGTGLQAVAARLAALGEGISHGIGVGGRDLSAAVGGMMTLFALEALADDPGTEAIVLISKPPHPEILARIEAALAAIEKPVVVCCLGAPPKTTGRAMWVATLDDAANATAAFLQGRIFVPQAFDDPVAVRARLTKIRAEAGESGNSVVGLFTGGTLAHEAHLILEKTLGDTAYNGKAFEIDGSHQVIDLGDDAYTVGRPHPMIAPDLRAELIARTGGLAEVGVVLLDLVLGKGAHEDPATSVVAGLATARAKAGHGGSQIGRRGVGRRKNGGRPAESRRSGGPPRRGGRPGLSVQCPGGAVRRPGRAARTGGRHAGRQRMTDRPAIFDADLSVINIGIETFADDLRDAGIDVVHVDWRPPCAGDANLAALLAGLDDDD